MITLFHCVSARSFRPLWMLEEIGLPYELKMLPFPPRVHARSYLDVNPLGTVPALFLDDAGRMTESAAICQYLAARHSPGVLDVAPHEADFGGYLNYAHFEPPERRQQQVADDYTKWFLARLRTLEPLLAERAFLCAKRFTAADISVGYALMLAEHLQLSERFPPSIAAYWKRLREREAFQRALEAQRAAARAQGVPEMPAPDVR
jgi:glutathione S-transferase